MAVPQRFTIDDSIVVDAALTVRHSGRVTITKHPIEEGANPTDHAKEEPDVITLEGCFTNFPLTEADRTARGGHERFTTGGYAAEQIGRLRALKSSRRAVSVRSARRSYTNMIVTSVEELENYKDGDAAMFTASFEQIRFVKTESVRFAQVSKPSSVPRKPQKKLDKAKQVAESAPQNRSIAATLNDSTGDYAGKLVHLVTGQ